ncbi:unnamed protein product [Meloidogyne enterolobii]|uniref:Uncharacterized protein n=1 Tax=Meloidogyne enterolobii TaxID=390850 RepID=A0ACB1AGD5_MELEN
MNLNMFLLEAFQSLPPLFYPTSTTTSTSNAATTSTINISSSASTEQQQLPSTLNDATSALFQQYLNSLNYINSGEEGVKTEAKIDTHKIELKQEEIKEEGKN